MEVQDQELYYRNSAGLPLRVILSYSGRKKLLQEFHDGLAHFGEKTTFELISNVAWWPTLHHDVVQYLQSCPAGPVKAGPYLAQAHIGPTLKIGSNKVA
jgi:hypothetical protein